MSQSSLTEQQPLHVNPYEREVREHAPAVGDVYCDRSPHRTSYHIFRLAERVESKYGPRWRLEVIQGWEKEEISEGQLKEYYRPLLNDFNTLQRYADMVVEGKSEEVAKAILGAEAAAAPVDTEALMASESPQHIAALLDESERLHNMLAEVKLTAELIVTRKKSELEAQTRKMEEVVGKMMEKVNNLVKIITVLNLYTGQNVDIEQLCDGEPASPLEIPHIRQRILYMDEELCAHLDHEADYHDIALFKEWVTVPENRDIIVPEQRCIVALKPKRFDMDYRSGDRFYDAQREIWNKHTYILIRNGERLYLVDSEDLELFGSTFPHSDFEEKYQRQMVDPQQSFKDSIKRDHDCLRYVTTKFMVFVQGILDAKDLLAPLIHHPNLMKAEHVILVRDDEDLLGTGLKPWKEFRNEKNALIRRGTRIVYMPGRTYRETGPTGRYGSYTNSGDFVKYYTYDSSKPAYPGPGIYHADEIETVVDYDHGKPVTQKADYFVFRYLPGDKIWSRDIYDCEQHDRKKRVAWKYDPMYVLNYDAVSIKELQAYFNDRTLRPEFRDMMPLLKHVLLQKKAELEDEKDFKNLVSSQILRETGKDVSDEALDEAVAWWKMKVIYSRPLRSDDAKAFRMIKQRLLSNV